MLNSLNLDPDLWVWKSKFSPARNVVKAFHSKEHCHLLVLANVNFITIMSN